MLLKRIHIQNFRSICNAEINLAKQTAILGGNGVGKSTVLRALEKFYGASTQVDLDDFFGRDARESIKIALTFMEFSEDETIRFASRIHGAEMTVMRTFEAKGKASGQYFGLTKRYAGFSNIRETVGALEKRNAYTQLRDSNLELFGMLPRLTRAADIDDALGEWEANHPESCDLMLDDGRFFGFTNVANGALQKATSFVFIPAVRDASADAIDGRTSSPISKLMELVVRSAVQQRDDIQTWQARITAEYRELTDPENLRELNELSGQLTATLRDLYADSGVNLTWKPAKDFEVPLPTADVALEDGGFQSPVDRQGHGLQRAFIITLLQHLALAINNSQLTTDDTGPTNGVLDTLHAVPQVRRALPGLILAIEEPELYQHPSKQRHFASVLTRLTSGALPGVAGTTQVIFASHSPYFVSVDRFDEVRIARRFHLPGTNCKQCRLTQAQLEQVLRRLEGAFSEPENSRTPEGLKARLHVFTSDLAEGFFSEVVVLVEGTSDRAALFATAQADNVDFESLGVVILIVGGKENMPNPAAIFRALAIPVYLVWDCDMRPGREESAYNGILQRVAAQDPRTAVPFAARNYVGEQFACFGATLDRVLQDELTNEVYTRQLNTAAAMYGLAARNDPQKAPAVMTEMIGQASSEGYKSTSLSAIVDAIRNMALRARATIRT